VFTVTSLPTTHGFRSTLGQLSEGSAVCSSPFVPVKWSAAERRQALGNTICYSAAPSVRWIRCSISLFEQQLSDSYPVNWLFSMLLYFKLRWYKLSIFIHSYSWLTITFEFNCHCRFRGQRNDSCFRDAS
jgi:hypothetical protein